MKKCFNVDKLLQLITYTCRSTLTQFRSERRVHNERSRIPREVDRRIFSGYGKNKMTWVMHLLRKGFSLYQLPQAFVTHYPHLDSASRQKWNGGKVGAPRKKLPDKTPTAQWLETPRGRTDHLFLQFRDWLQRTVPDERRVHACPTAEDDDYRLWIHRDAKIE